MNAPRTDDELLHLLSVALDPAPVRPTLADHEQLRQALAAESDRAEGQDSQHKVRSLRRLPHPVAAAVVVAALTTGGAAAAVKTDTLPGPLRTLASDVGIPVTAPALQQVDADLAALRSALNAGDAHAIGADAAALSRDLDTLNPDDRITVDGEVNLLLAQAGAWLAAHQSVVGGQIGHGGDNAATGGASGSGSHDARRGSGTPDQGQNNSNTSNTSNTDHAGSDSSGGGTVTGGATGSGPGPGGTDADGRQDGEGNASSGQPSVTGQTPVNGGGGSSAGGGEEGSGSSSGQGGSSTSGGDGSSSSASAGPGVPEAPSSGDGSDGGNGGG